MSPDIFHHYFHPFQNRRPTVKHVARPPAGACRGNVQPPAGRAHTAGIRYGRRPAALARTHAGIRYGRRLAALTRDKVPPQAGRTCEQSMRRPAALARTHAGIRYACTAARRGNVQPPAGRAHTAARRTAGGRDKVRPILISCEHSLLAGEACLQTKVCIRRENSCRQDVPACYPHILRA